MSTNFLITGTGRCGTGYASAMLSMMGIPTGHEEVFNPPAIESGTFDWRLPGEASWLGAGFLGELDMPVVQLVRNPLETLKSLVGLRWLSYQYPHGLRAGFEDYAMQFLGREPYPATTGQAARLVLIKRNVDFMWDWTAMIEKHDTLLVRVEDLPEDDALVKYLTGGPALPFPPLGTRVNSRARDETIYWSEAGPKLSALAEKWGYERK